MANASLVQWLEYLPSKQVARVRFPDDAPFLHWDCGRHLRHHVGRHPKTQVHGGLAQSVECVVRNDEAPGSKPGFSTFCSFRFVARRMRRAFNRSRIHRMRSYSLVVRTPRCGRGNPGSNPGRGI